MTTSSSRREFLRWSSRLSLAGTATPFALNMAALNAASAQSASDYKALVCVFLYGGNDNANTLIPFDSASHAVYARARDGLARPRDALRVLGAPLTDLQGREMALPAELAPLRERFDAGRLAVVANVGPLLAPVSQQALRNGSVPLPPKLFSHNDQQSTWQSSAPEGARAGWGGRLGDALAASNRNATYTSISVTGNAVWSSGQSVLQYQVGPGGAVPVNALGGDSLFGSSAAPALLRQLMTADRGSLLQKDHAALMRRTLDTNQELGTALSAAPVLRTLFPDNNGLASQLRMVARLIAARSQLGARRQVFFVSLGGFDHHAFLSNGHPPLLAQLGQALAAFDQATIELGVDNQVTTFTASDFGRALTPNGDGSDHGWGSHHFVMGSAVRGRDIYGQLPVVALGTPEDAGQGRLLPTTSVDQYAATFGRWLGVSDTQLSELLPNLNRFSPNVLPLMRT